MTKLPDKTEKSLGLLIDLDICVGCHACVMACKGWNNENYGAPLSDQNARGKDPSGSFLNRVHSYEAVDDDGAARLIHFPKSCLHCEDAPCVTVCPTGASLKRSEDGIVLVNEDDCMGCGLCAWACPYGARELDQDAGVMKKCTLCVDRIDNENLPEEDRVPACVRTCPADARAFGDYSNPEDPIFERMKGREEIILMPEMNTNPVNRYLAPRKKSKIVAPLEPVATDAGGFLNWLDKTLEKL